MDAEGGRSMVGADWELFGRQNMGLCGLPEINWTPLQCSAENKTDGFDPRKAWKIVISSIIPSWSVAKGG